MAAITTIVQQPAVELWAAYRPLEYSVLVVGDPSAVAAEIDVQIHINGQPFGQPFPVRHFRHDSLLSASYSSFVFNVNNQVQAFFDQRLFYPDIATGAPLNRVDFVANVQVEIITYYPDVDQVLQLDPAATDTSTAVPVINAYRRAEESRQMTEYYAPTATSQPLQVKFLTRKPARTIVTLTDSEYLAVYAAGLYSMRILAYDQDGTSVAGQIEIGATAYGAEEMAILPVGPANINAIPVSAWLANTSQVTISSTTKYYIVQVGWHCPGGSFTNLSEVRRYYLVPDDCQTHRVHFINSFGAPDAFSIFNSKNVAISTASEQMTRPLAASYDVDAEAQQVVSRRSQVTVKTPIGGLTKEERVWLVEEFSRCTNLRLEQDGIYIPARLRDVSASIVDTEAPLDSIVFTIDYSQTTLSQRN
jgi:hypothetical protein